MNLPNVLESSCTQADQFSLMPNVSESACARADQFVILPCVIVDNCVAGTDTIQFGEDGRILATQQDEAVQTQGGLNIGLQ